VSNPYFTNNIPEARAMQGEPKVVRGASLRITRATPGSQGKDVREEIIDYTNRFTQAEDWVGNLSGTDEGPASGFGRWEDTYSETESLGRFPIDHMLGSLSDAEEKQLLQSEGRGGNLMSKARVTRDPVTLIPDNIAEQDPRAESDAFFGSDKYPRQLENVMKRYDDVDRMQEQVDYKDSKAMPIKIIRRKP
jgi:hypothetical protein